MLSEEFLIDGIPAVLYGPASETVWLFIHGQFGCKEEAAAFAEAACPAGAQVLAVDLPGHGARRDKGETFAPWTAAPELARVMDYAKAHWSRVCVRATSIGAYFARLAFGAPEKALFVSPIVDMERLILDRMRRADVSETVLREAGEILCAEGDALSWDYLTWVRAHPAHDWFCPTCILYGGRDDMTDRDTIERYAAQHAAELTILPEGEHWFHTPAQLDAMLEWETENV